MDVGDDDLFSTIDFGHGGAEETDGAGAEDQDGAVGFEGGATGAVNCDAEGFEDGAEFEGDVVWEPISIVISIARVERIGEHVMK